MSVIPRIQEVVVPILRAASLKQVASEDYDELPVTVNTWIPDIDYRTFPIIQVRRLGGVRLNKRPTALSLPVIELTCYTSAHNGGDLVATEQLYEDALEALYTAVRRQVQTDAGYLHSIKETQGAIQFSSLFQDSWRIQGLIQLGVRPPRSP